MCFIKTRHLISVQV